MKKDIQDYGETNVQGPNLQTKSKIQTNINKEPGEGVGKEEQNNGFGLGKAPKNARPQGVSEKLVNITKDDNLPD